MTVSPTDETSCRPAAAACWIGKDSVLAETVEGSVTFHTARSTAYPQPAAGEGAGPGPLKVPTEQLPGMLGVTRVAVVKHPRALRLDDTTIA